MSNDTITPSKIPLCTDLDDTLIKTDLVFESLFCFIKKNPLNILAAIWWFIKGGRPTLKRKLSENINLSYSSLPYNDHVVDFLKEERAKGREIVLASASDAILLEGIANNLKCFDRILGSDGKNNLKGENKRAELVRLFGEKGFDYIGDSRADLKVWPSARECLVVSSNENYINKVRRIGNVTKIFDNGKKNLFLTLLKSIRLYQWVKNLLVFVPLLMAHKFSDIGLLISSLQAFFAFSFCASSVYVINDLLDLESDRLHPVKRKRPFASGALSITYGFILLPALIIFAFIFSFPLNNGFKLALLTYFLTTFAYSLKLKQIVITDILVLASLYTLRIFAGGLAADTVISHWLLIFSMFFFLSLAGVKRFSELQRLRTGIAKRMHGRGYQEADLEVIGASGITGGVLSVFVLAVYVTSTAVTNLYTKPQILLLICPLLLYWIMRIWLFAYRGKLHEDPILFAINDRASYVLGILSFLIMTLAI